MGVFGRGHVRGHVRFGSDHVTIKNGRNPVCGTRCVPMAVHVPLLGLILYRPRDLYRKRYRLRTGGGICCRFWGQKPSCGTVFVPPPGFVPRAGRNKAQKRALPLFYVTCADFVNRKFKTIQKVLINQDFCNSSRLPAILPTCHARSRRYVGVTSPKY